MPNKGSENGAASSGFPPNADRLCEKNGLTGRPPFCDERPREWGDLDEENVWIFRCCVCSRGGPIPPALGNEEEKVSAVPA